jgi:predicted acyltransferase (DUF342 family)
MKNLLIILFVFITGNIYAQSPDSILINNDSIIYKTSPIDNDVSSSDDNIFSIEKIEDDKERIVTIKIDSVLFKKRFKEKKVIIKRAFKIHKESLRKTKEEMREKRGKEMEKD